MQTNLENLRAQAAAARREWEAATTYETRKPLENRYLTLRALAQRMEPVQPVTTRVTRPEKWRTMAERAVRS